MINFMTLSVLGSAKAKLKEWKELMINYSATNCDWMLSEN